LRGGSEAHRGRAQGYSGQSAQGRAAQGRTGYSALSAVTSLVTAMAQKKADNPTVPGGIQPEATPGSGPHPVGDTEGSDKPVDQQGSVAFTSMPEIEAAVNQDIAACTGAMSSASQCCGNPTSCRGNMNAQDSRSLDAVSALLNRGPSQGGLKDYCNQMKTMSGDSRNLNSGLAGVCFDAQSSCETVCEDLAEEYTQFIAECNGCKAQTVYQNALSRFQDTQRSCSNLGDKADQLADTGFDAAVNQAISKNCTDVSASNPVLASAATPTGASQTDVRDTRSLGLPESRKTESSASGDIGGPPTQKPRMDLSVDAAQGFKGYGKNLPPELQRNVAGASGAPARGSSGFKPAAAETPAAAAPVKDAKKDDKPKAEEPPKTDDKKRAPAAAEPAHMIGSNSNQFEDGKDLSQYLPAGVRTAMNRSGGGKEINDAAEDLFARITAKIKEKCKLGVLLECGAP